MVADGMDEEGRWLELRIYARRVSWAIVFVAGILFASGLRLSGVDFDELGAKTRQFNPAHHICLKTERLDTTEGDPGTVQFCTEWIDLKDTTGRVYTLSRKDLEVVRNMNGKIYTRLKKRINVPLIGAIGFLAVLVVTGKLVQHKLIKSRRIRMGLADEGKTG